jgi:hypothetical protein
MIWELLIICATVYLLFGEYMKAKSHHLEMEAELMEAEIELIRARTYRREE